MKKSHCLSLMTVFVSLHAGCHAEDASETESSPRKTSDKWLANGEKVTLKKFLPTENVTALLYAQNQSSWKKSVIFSPGGFVPAAAMENFAQALASRGHVVYVLNYLANLPILPTEPAKIVRLAQELKAGATNLQGVPLPIKTAQAAGLPLIAIGHSLGGAILSDAIEQSDSPLSRIVLFGVSKLTRDPKTVAVPTQLVVGAEDGLVSPSGLDDLERTLGTTRLTVENVNHFCIIPDSTVGDAKKRAQDKAISVSPQKCIETLTEAMATAGIL